MGKRLIINGVDFSNVAVDKEVVARLVYDNIDWTQTENSINTHAHYACGVAIGQYDWNATAGKKIIGVKVNVKEVRRGSFQFIVVRGFRQNAVQDANGEGYDNECEAQTLLVDRTGVQTIMLPTPVVLTENDWVGVGSFEDNDNSISALCLDENKNTCFVYSPYYTSAPNTYTDCTTERTTYAPACLDLLYEVE